MKSKVKENKIKFKSKINASREFFEITDKQKEELATIAIRFKNLFQFNLFTFLLRFKKLRGYFPPPDKAIKVCQAILKNREQFKNMNLWAYMTKAITKETALSFADKNIKEAQSFKDAQPIGLLINPALLEGGHNEARR